MNVIYSSAVICLILLAELQQSTANLQHHVSHGGIRSVNQIGASSFADDLFARYDNNGSIAFERLLEALKIGRKDNKTETFTGDMSKKCFSASSILYLYSINKTTLNSAEFEKVCPAIVQQIEGKACEPPANDDITVAKFNKPAHAWGYGFLSVAIISLASILGAFVVPFMNRSFYKILLLFMVSLAVGVLTGSGLFHLIPGTFGLGHGLPRFKSAVIIAGIYLFFFMEYLMKMYIRFKDPSYSGHSHHHEEVTLPKLSKKNEIPEDGIAGKLSSYQHDHEQARSNPASVDSNLNEKPLENSSQTMVVDPNEGKKKKNKIAPVAWMIIIGDGLHNFIDGLAIGAGYSASSLDGLSTSLAIFCEELPHELGDFAVLLSSGMSYKQAMFFNFLSACLCFLGLVVGLLIGQTTGSAVKWIKALAGGMFLYIGLVDMLQEATEMSFREGQGSVKKNLKTFALQNFGMLLGFAIMLLLAVYSDKIKESI